MMPMVSHGRFLFLVRVISLGAFFVMFPPRGAGADSGLLREIIAAYNAEALERSLRNGTYRGEAGMLRIDPDTGRELGLNPYVDADYEGAKGLYQRADLLFKEVRRILRSARSRTCGDAAVRRLARTSAAYNEAVQKAREMMRRYHGRLGDEDDPRLRRGSSEKLMNRLLARAMDMADNNLRDGLGRFYNMCAGQETVPAPLTTRNVRFVNHVFREFSARAPGQALGRYDLDRNKRNGAPSYSALWRQVPGDRASRVIPVLASVVTSRRRSGAYTLDPLLFMALIRQESNFDPKAVSPAGAAGLTQIMPATGKGMGMTRIFSPPYFKEARSFTLRERERRRSAMAMIPKIRSADMVAPAGRACELMRLSGKNREKRLSLYRRYRKELLKRGGDDRLDPEKSIQFGYQYFSEMMKRHKGDMSLALAAYNAGPHRVKQYRGIPPFTETVGYRNRVLRYYRGYLQDLRKMD